MEGSDDLTNSFCFIRLLLENPFFRENSDSIQRSETMGVPKFFRYISERYPNLSELVGTKEVRCTTRISNSYDF